LARAGSARNQDVEPTAAGDLEYRRHLRRQVALPLHRLQRDLVARELADGDRSSVQGQRRDDDVDARTIGQTRIAQRRRFIHPSADAADDPRTHAEHVSVVPERDVGELKLAFAFHVNLVRAVDHDVGNGLVAEQGFQRTEAQQIVEQGGYEITLLLGVQLQLLLDQDLADNVTDLTGQILQ
jgi:hypothetical protein